MKKMITAGLLAAILTLSYIVAPAQEKETVSRPKWVSENGYWVIEGNIKSPLSHTVRFYSNDDQLVYTEKIEGVKLNAHKRKVKMKLKQALDAAIIAWEGKKENMDGLALIKEIL